MRSDSEENPNNSQPDEMGPFRPPDLTGLFRAVDEIIMSRKMGDVLQLRLQSVHGHLKSNGDCSVSIGVCHAATAIAACSSYIRY